MGQLSPYSNKENAGEIIAFNFLPRYVNIDNCSWIFDLFIETTSVGGWWYVKTLLTEV